MADHPTLAELAKACYENSAAHGFWNEQETAETIPSKLMLIVSEVGEALESYRDPESDNLIKVPVDLFEHLVGLAEDAGSPAQSESAVLKADQARSILDKWKAKPKGFDIEIADAFIRLLDLAGRKGIDVEDAILRKHEYNKTRPYRHRRLV